MTDDSHIAGATSRNVLERVRAAQSPERQARTARLAEIKKKYVTTERDAELSDAFDWLLDEALANMDAGRSEGRVLLVTGKAGAGKTWAVDELLRKRPELQQYHSDVGLLMPVVRIICPSPCTLKQLGRALLTAMGFALERDPQENIVWERVRHGLKLRQVVVVHIDEAQHCMRNVNPFVTQSVRDSIKRCMQIEGWPVQFLLSGLPSLTELAAGEKPKQQERRRKVVHFPDLEFPEDADFVRWVVQHVAADFGSLDIRDVLSDEFQHRLCRASRYQFGRLAENTVSATEKALERGAKKLKVEHFAELYREQTGCHDEENMFTASNFYQMSFPKARSDDEG